ncbi:MAG: ATP-dependent Clp protease proteolytic subunit, partial [Crocinitomicaceae bacterium]
MCFSEATRIRKIQVVLNQPRSGTRGQATDIQIYAQEVLANKKAVSWPNAMKIFR